MLPTPDLPDGSWAAPPLKAYSIAIRGTVASCTNQASMPPGETSRWIFAAACDGVAASDQQHGAGDQAGCEALRANRKTDHERFSSRFGAASLIR